MYEEVTNVEKSTINDIKGKNCEMGQKGVFLRKCGSCRGLFLGFVEWFSWRNVVMFCY